VVVEVVEGMEVDCPGGGEQTDTRVLVLMDASGPEEDPGSVLGPVGEGSESLLPSGTS